MDFVEGMEDICASLGLGHIPLLNAENRELNRQLQELQVNFLLSSVEQVLSEIVICFLTDSVTKKQTKDKGRSQAVGNI